MAATLYRIDGTARTYSGLFPTGAGATYDLYGSVPFVPFMGEARSVQLAQRTTVGVPQTVTAVLGQRTTEQLGQTVVASVSQRSTVQLPKE